MPRKPKLTRDQVVAAADRVARGETRTVIAAEHGVTAAALGQALKKLAAEEPPKPKPRPKAKRNANEDPERYAERLEGQEAAGQISPDELREHMSAEIKDLQNAKANAETELERRKVQELLVKTYSAYQRVISRDDPDMLSMRRSDIKAKADQLRGLFIARAESGRPQHCEACGVKLAQSWAKKVIET